MFDIYDANLQRLGPVENIQSRSWNIAWQDTGGITLAAMATDRNLRLLQNGNFISVSSGSTEILYIIVNVGVSTDGQTITVNGKYCDYVLRQRSAEAADVPQTTAEAEVSGLIRGSGLPFSVVASGSTSLPPYSRSAGRLNDLTLDVLRSVGLGRRCQRSGGNILYIVDYGRDLRDNPAVPVFGRNCGHFHEISYADDVSEADNVATARLVYLKKDPVTISEGETSASGILRKELFYGTLTQVSGDSDEAFTASARAQLRQALRENARRVTMTARVDWDDYGSIYRCGDLLRVEDALGGGVRRIISAKWSWDSSGKSLSITLGDPMITVLKEIKRISKAVGGGGARKSAEKVLADYKELVARVTSAEAGVQAAATRTELGDLKTAQAVMYASINETTASISASVTKIQNSIQSIIDIKADLINLSGAVSVTNGAFTVKGAITSTAGISHLNSLIVDGRVKAGSLQIGENSFIEKAITSTDGTAYTVLAQ